MKGSDRLGARSANSPAKASTQVMFIKIPPAAAGGLFSPNLPRTRKILRNPTGGSRWIVQSQPTEDTKDSPQSHRRQPVDRSVPTFVSPCWTRGLGLNDP